MTRYVVILHSQRDRDLAKRAIDKAPSGYAVDIHEAKRSDDQNKALWSLLNQITRQRPVHNCTRMDEETWKCVFMSALGHEMRMIPNLEGDGYIPIGHRSSQLTKSQFSDLITVILAWAEREQLTIKHFDEKDKAA